MAGRSEARIFASIWNDPTFRALTRSQQGMYFFLLSQPDLSFCGVLSLRPRRWAQKAAGLTPEQVQADLKALAEPFPEGLPEGFPEGADNPFIVIDENTEEVFVRSLIRHDGIWKQPNLLKAAREAATLVESPAILRAMLEELKRIPAHESSSTLVKSVMADFIADLETTLGKPSGNPPGKGSANPSAEGPQGKGEGNGDVVEDSPLPKTPLPKNSSSPASPSRDTGPSDEHHNGPDPEDSGEIPGLPPVDSTMKRPEPGSDDDPDWREFWDPYPRKVDKDKARKAWAKAIKETAPFVIIAGAKRYRELVIREGRDKKYIKHPTTWLNGKCWNDEINLDGQPPGKYAVGSGSELPPRDSYDPKDFL